MHNVWAHRIILFIQRLSFANGRHLSGNARKVIDIFDLKYFFFVFCFLKAHNHLKM
jgi:hypothetical protein